MCKVLSELLGVDDPLFAIGLHDLEKASGNGNADVRLSAEIIGKAFQKTRELGLDPKDTTGEELYLALQELIKRHDAFLARKIGAKDPSDAQDVLVRLHKFVKIINVPKSAWVLKPTAAKRLLKSTPPKKVMKQLGYRSIDSMLKRESATELFAGMRFTESQEWLTNFTKKYKKLQAKDFEVRPIEFLLLDAKKWGQSSGAHVRKSRHNITHMKELGVIAILPLPVERLNGLTITLLSLILHYVNEIRMYTTYFKMQQVRSDFGGLIVEALVKDPHNHARVAGHNLHWRHIHRHFGKKDATRYPEVFEPHVQSEDLFWRKTEEILYRIEPALHFWFDMDFVAARTTRPISFNLLDNAVSYVNGLKYGEQSMHHFRDSLWNEIYARYLGQSAMEYLVVRQLTKESVEPDFAANILEEFLV
jgi:hypothetical protein